MITCCVCEGVIPAGRAQHAVLLHKRPKFCSNACKCKDYRTRNCSPKKRHLSRHLATPCDTLADPLDRRVTRKRARTRRSVIDTVHSDHGDQSNCSTRCIRFANALTNTAQVIIAGRIPNPLPLALTDPVADQLLRRTISSAATRLPAKEGVSMAVRTTNTVRTEDDDLPRKSKRERKCNPRAYANFVFDHLRPFQSVRVPDYTGKNGKLWCALFSEYGDAELKRLILETIRERNTKLKFMQRNGERFTAACVYYYGKTFYKTTTEVAQTPKEIPAIVLFEMGQNGIPDNRIKYLADLCGMSPAELCRKSNHPERAVVFEEASTPSALRGSEDSGTK